MEEQGVKAEIKINIQDNYGTVIGLQVENLIVKAKNPVVAFNRAVLDPLRALYQAGYDKTVLILVDALDEAGQHGGKEKIYNLIAGMRGLDRRVRLLLTLRPDNTILGHIEGMRRTPLRLEDLPDNNRSDADAYVLKKLPGLPGLRQRLAEIEMDQAAFLQNVWKSCQGNFQYLVLLLPALERNELWVADIGKLPEGLDGIYREYLRTRQVGKSRQAWRFYRPVLGTLAVAAEPLDSRQIENYTGLEPQDVVDVLVDAAQFLDNPGGKWGLFHQSMADFLLDRAKAGDEFWIDARAVHRKIASAYAVYTGKSWNGCDDYGMHWLVHHLIHSEDVVSLLKALLDFERMQARLLRSSSRDLVDEYARAGVFLEGQAADLLDAHRHPEIGLLRAALTYSAQVIASDPTQLAGQLMGQLEGQAAGLEDLLAGARAWRGAAWLRPLRASLPRPGGSLLVVPSGHKGTVRSLAISPDGRRAASAGNSHPDCTLRFWDLEHGVPIFVVENEIPAGGFTPLAIDFERFLGADGHRHRYSHLEPGNTTGRPPPAGSHWRHHLAGGSRTRPVCHLRRQRWTGDLLGFKDLAAGVRAGRAHGRARASLDRCEWTPGCHHLNC